ncbi:MAG TPA: hypothetical protein VIL46_18020, partial [Gemmataceae bacterium]
MRHHRFRLSLPAAAALALAAAAAGQEQQAPRPKVQPLLRLEAPGPTTLVAALAAGPGESLYAAGFDKVVRVWEFDANAGRFAPRPDRALRTPIGPGLDGALNAVAVSPDGRWAAAAGNSPNRYAAGFRDPGITLPRADAMTDEMLLDQGAVYLFDLRKGSLRVLRGHKGPVMALAFAAGRPGGAPVLVSAAKEEDPKTGDPVGAVRAWDAAAGASLGAYRLPRVNPDVRPALAAGPTGAGPHDLAVFVAWDNGELWRWDLAAGPPRVVSDDQRYNNALAVSPDGAWLLGGTFDARREAQKGQVWSRALRGAGGVRHRAEFPPLALPGGRTSFFVPRGLAPFASRPGGPADRLAVLLRAATTRPGSDAFDESYHLAVLAWDAAAGRPGPELARVQLWDGPGRVPSVAAVAGGRFLAVAGGPGHAVAVFGAAALERGADGPLQRLQSGGRTFRSAAFASRGDAWGLVLDGSLLFDFSGPELRKAADDWKDASPDPRGWQVEETPGGTSLTVRSPAGKRVIDFAPSKWTAHALVPPGEGRPRALLAVGLLSEADQPELRLYDLSTGRQVRRCTGHTARITSLAARADGRLLASTSEDQTVRLWSLADLDRAAVRLGQLDGVGVREEGDRLVVSRVEPDGPAAGKLTRGEPVEGIVIGGELRPYRKAYDFYLAVSRTPPGRDLTLRLGGAKARDVALPVAQGVDERKPLLSLFIFGDDPRPEWVGWSPHG